MTTITVTNKLNGKVLSQDFPSERVASEFVLLLNLDYDSSTFTIERTQK